MKFKVISSNANSEGGFVTKLSREISKETFVGIKKMKLTFYISGTKQLEIGSEQDINPTDWTIREYPFVTPEGEEIMLKWLHLKG